MKCNQSSPGIELVSPCPYPVTITITPRAPQLTWLDVDMSDVSFTCSKHPGHLKELIRLWPKMTHAIILNESFYLKKNKKKKSRWGEIIFTVLWKRMIKSEKSNDLAKGDNFIRELRQIYGVVSLILKIQQL